MCLIRLALRLQQEGRKFWERDSDDVRARLYGNSNVQMVIGELVVFRSGSGHNGEKTDANAVDHDFDLRRLAQTFHMLVAVTSKPDLKFIFSIDRKRVRQREATPGSDREV